ncbi:hypothetical protein [Longimicrobium sp.]|uniref:hypothetical protein n=1 Tax=Longimicrobium sp. TaxID=2029185 RepID=UPI002E3372EC|nr:hypothetical protein [Longimicrobium sp.]HEX6039134.1 hypothetical protein [Longimicrobium sp.]
MSRERDRFRGVVEEELARRRAGVNDGVLRILDLLRLLQSSIRDVLGGLPSEFDQAFLPRLLAQVGVQIARWQAGAEDVALGFFEAAARRGPGMVDGPLGAAGIRVSGGLISDSLVRTLADYSADKLSIALADGRAAIEAHIRLGVLGGQSPQETMAGIGRELKDPGPFGRIRLRSEMIMRTETGRIHSTSAQARLEEALDLVPDLGKEWLWSRKSRAAHAAANGQKRGARERFDVGGEKLMFPRDPSGSAENNVGCGCESIPYLARWST